MDSAHPAPFDDLGPERVFHYYEPRLRLRAAVVIDTVRFGISGGGVRMAPDLTLEEMARLARAMSYKFAMLDLPCGGAKAGIWFDPAAAARPQMMRTFIEWIRPLVETGIYAPGADMGTTAADFAPLFPESGASRNLGEQEFEGMPLEDQVTGYGVVIAARAACEFLGRPLRGARVAIEGFGKVGVGTAKYLARAGARVLAVSTVRGTLYDPDGLDVPTLMELRAAHGDAVVERWPHGQRLPCAALFTLPVDIVIPGARPDSISTENAAAIRASLIVPAANIPYGDGAVALLHRRGIVALPDFVTNAGGVLAGVVGLSGGAASDVFTMVENRIADNIRRVLRAASAGTSPAYDAAVGIAHQRLTSPT